MSLGRIQILGYEHLLSGLLVIFTSDVHLYPCIEREWWLGHKGVYRNISSRSSSLEARLLIQLRSCSQSLLDTA